MEEEQGFKVLSGEEFAEAFKHPCEICGEELTIDNSVEHHRQHEVESGKILISESDKIQDLWYREAEAMTLADLPAFMRKLSQDYSHDYGTICHAMSAAALAAVYAIEHSPVGGITGFQSSFVMWGFITHWQHLEGKPVKLVKYEDMLYPQYKEKFSSISKETWEWLQAEASKKLEEAEGFVHPHVIEHWQSIKDGIVPFGFEVEN